LVHPHHSLKEKEEIEIDAASHEGVFIPRGTAHRVKMLDHEALLLIYASAPESEKDCHRFSFEL
jgi:hypothetical protein